MKNLFLFLFFFVLLSCGKEVSESPPTVSTEETGILSPLQAEINYARAKSIAQEAPTRFGGEFTKSIFKTVLDGEAITAPNTQTKSGAIDTLLYVFNYAEGGYAVIPTLETESDLIAYVEEGEFNIEDTLTSDLSRFLVSLMMDYQRDRVIKHTQEQATKSGDLVMGGGPMCGNVIAASGIHFKYLGEPTQTPEYVARKGDDYYKNNGCYLPLQYTEAENTYREPLLTTTWDQDKPYNMACPDNSKTGCVAIAVSQIMVYHSVPTIYPQNILDANKFSVPSHLKSYVGRSTYITSMKKVKDLSEASFAAKDNASRFIAIIGYMLKNDWGTDETGAKDKEVPKVFNNMGYTSGGVVKYNGNSVEAALNSARPVYITGYKPGIFSISGHAWVVDGYKLEDDVRQNYIYFFDEYGAYHARRLSQPYGGYAVRRTFFHHNFGWGGTWNGYYLDGVFNTAQIHESTGTIGQENRVYDRIEIIPDIFKQ